MFAAETAEDDKPTPKADEKEKATKSGKGKDTKDGEGAKDEDAGTTKPSGEKPGKGNNSIKGFIYIVFCFATFLLKCDHTIIRTYTHP